MPAYSYKTRAGRYLGHSSVEVTRATYIHETQEERERISALLEGVLGKSFPG